MMELHYYTPWQFCGLTQDESWGSMFYYWGNGNHSTSEPSRNATWGEESEVERLLGLMKTKFVDKGIPVIIGEFGAIKRTNPSDLSRHLASREYFNRYLVSSARGKGMIPVYWDNGASDFGLFNRSSGAATDQGVINAIMQGAGGGSTTNYINLRNRATGLMIDGMGRTSNGSNCGQYAAGGSHNQQWIIETAGSYIKLKNRGTGLYLDGMGRTTNGSIAGQWASSSSNNQQWTQEAAGAYVKFRNRATGLYLDGMGRTANGDDLGQWATSNSANQQWTMTTVANARLSTEPSITEPQVNNELRVSPNPFKSTFNIRVDNPAEVERVLIFDLLGKQVEVSDRSAGLNLQSMGASLKPGMYILKIYGAGWMRSFKVIKN
jgi:hypothetical protein